MLFKSIFHRSQPKIARFDREFIAAHYLKGEGLEVGALHAPLELQPGVRVRYGDFANGDALNNSYPEISTFTKPDLITDLETLRGIEDESLDFLIANHVLEHCEDPIAAMKSVVRTLRTQGIGYLAVPDKRFTFDVEREVTPLEHLIRDHEEGPDWSLRDHYEEWVRLVDKIDGEERKAKIATMLEQRSNIHFHVWEYPDMMRFFTYLLRDMALPLSVEMSCLLGIEVIWVFRKL